jgi:N-acetyl-anhydromuramoyl-L-alanine amidase
VISVESAAATQTEMQRVSAEGWLSGVEQIHSPNFDNRPQGEEISLLVLHGISLPEGVFGTPFIDQLFTNQLQGDESPSFEPLKGLRVSTHLLIRRGGELVQYVSLNERAWHAGVSSFEGRTRCNDFSIGIELEGSDETPYSEAQYQQLRGVIPLLHKHYPAITQQRIVAHSDIAPGRKTDPGPAFEWQRIAQLV